MVVRAERRLASSAASTCALRYRRHNVVRLEWWEVPVPGTSGGADEAKHDSGPAVRCRYRAPLQLVHHCAADHDVAGRALWCDRSPLELGGRVDLGGRDRSE